MVSKASCLNLSLLSLLVSEAEATPPVPVLPPARFWKSIAVDYHLLKNDVW